ncbi:MAG TPA: PRC-barrel domain-containing protein [Lacipirellulaceae bacterium]|nr:PRC-barrel domain-containing protein [Lacipirellulaceae bacterium]
MLKRFSGLKALVAALAVAGLVQFGAGAYGENNTNDPTNVSATPAQATHRHHVNRTRALGQHRPATAFKASEIIGMNVRGKSGNDKIGSIKDLMVRSNGRVVYAAVGFGGFLGAGEKLFAVPMNAIEFVKDDNGSYARIDVTKETLKERTGFDKDNWPAVGDRSFLTHAGDNRSAFERQPDANGPRSSRSAGAPKSNNVTK